MPSTAMLQTKVGTFLKAARSAWILSGICCAAITSIEIANANAASIKVSSRVICIPRNRNPCSRGSASRSAGNVDVISSFRLFMRFADQPSTINRFAGVLSSAQVNQERTKTGRSTSVSSAGPSLFYFLISPARRNFNGGGYFLNLENPFPSVNSLPQRMAIILTPENVAQLVFLIRGEKVMLDAHLAMLYGVEVRVLNQAVARNRKRFPADFMFRLSAKEYENLRSQTVMSEEKSARTTYPLRSQFVISKHGRGGRRHRPYAFTEQGVAMLSSVGHSRGRALASYPRCITAYPRGSRARVFSIANAPCR